MPELTNSSVGSFAGTSGLEGTMVWPFERKYSRKLERMSLDFMEPTILPGGAEKPAERLGPAMRACRGRSTARHVSNARRAAPEKTPGRRGRPGQTPLLCVDAPVLQQPCPDRRHGPLVRRRQLLQCAAGVEGREQLAILLLRPRLARLRGQLRFSALEALLALEGRCRFVES